MVTLEIFLVYTLSRIRSTFDIFSDEQHFKINGIRSVVFLWAMPTLRGLGKKIVSWEKLIAMIVLFGKVG
jgi:hypothetical protein